MYTAVFKRPYKKVAIFVVCCLILIYITCYLVVQNRNDMIINGHHISSPITLVTAYFAINKSKHSAFEYDTWMENFLPKIETPLVIYTLGWTVPRLKFLRGNKPTVFHIYDSVWDIPVMSEMNNIYKEQHEKDPEKSLHSPELYAIWNSKPWMASNAVDENAFRSSFFYWVDIGCFRKENNTFKYWPDLSRVQHVFENTNFSDKIHIFTVNSLNTSSWDLDNEKMASRNNFIIGGFFGGSSKAVKWYSETYYKVHNEMLIGGHFVGKEQTVMNRLSINDNYTDKIIVTCSCKQEGYNPNFCGQKWHYFQNWYANDNERSEKCLVSNPHTLRDFSSF